MSGGVGFGSGTTGKLGRTWCRWMAFLAGSNWVVHGAWYVGDVGCCGVGVE